MLPKKTMEYPFPTPLYSRVPNKETTAWPEIKGGRGEETETDTLARPPIISGTAQC